MILKRIFQASSILRISIIAFLLWPAHSFSDGIFHRLKGQPEATQKSESSITVAGKLPQRAKTGDNNILERSYSAELSREVRSRYLLYLPWHYGDKDTNWPLLLYLHGGMGRGDRFDKMAWYPVPKMMLRNDSLPFIVIAPQCPAGEMWTDAEMLVSLIQNVCDSFSVDTNRIYLAGYSMGGAGVWFVAYKYPEKFAALAPMSGWSLRFSADRLKELPVWVFHGAEDSLVPVSEAEAMIGELHELNAEVKTSIVAGRSHTPPSIDEHKELFDWFLMHRRGMSDTGKVK
jgi:predicted peptidase